MKKKIILEPFYKSSFWNQFLLSVEIELSIKPAYLTISYQLAGPIEQLNWPAESSSPQFKEGLWQTTCFEFFYKEEGTDYTEWNFSPSHDYWFAQFSSPRVKEEEIKKRVQWQPPLIEIKKEENLFQMKTTFEIKRSVVTINSFKIQVAAVTQTVVAIEKEVPQNYWAISHNPTLNRPDFHQLDFFDTFDITRDLVRGASSDDKKNKTP